MLGVEIEPFSLFGRYRHGPRERLEIHGELDNRLVALFVKVKGSDFTGSHARSTIQLLTQTRQAALHILVGSAAVKRLVHPNRQVVAAAEKPDSKAAQFLEMDLVLKAAFMVRETAFVGCRHEDQAFDAFGGGDVEDFIEIALTDGSVGARRDQVHMGVDDGAAIVFAPETGRSFQVGPGPIHLDPGPRQGGFHALFTRRRCRYLENQDKEDRDARFHHHPIAPPALNRSGVVTSSIVAWRSSH